MATMDEKNNQLTKELVNNLKTFRKEYTKCTKNETMLKIDKEFDLFTVNKKYSLFIKPNFDLTNFKIENIIKMNKEQFSEKNDSLSFNVDLRIMYITACIKEINIINPFFKNFDKTIQFLNKSITDKYLKFEKNEQIWYFKLMILSYMLLISIISVVQNIIKIDPIIILGLSITISFPFSYLMFIYSTFLKSDHESSNIYDLILFLIFIFVGSCILYGIWASYLIVNIIHGFASSSIDLQACYFFIFLILFHSIDYFGIILQKRVYEFNKLIKDGLYEKNHVAFILKSNKSKK